MDRQTLTCCGEDMELENLRSLESYGYAEEAVIPCLMIPYFGQVCKSSLCHNLCDVEGDRTLLT
ncbi:hypothetical protein SADUNF_Sadunf06G0079200 [Salix dunnii]|uniref:Uncharacterized protein n=1 Tax=Salix dunnii TaxID=1413687 RepID=A0A835MWM4_9ROSI|nr:hypothetical protein SADUNF_Sadunf06G0079200 [Salix dunnii]